MPQELTMTSCFELVSNYAETFRKILAKDSTELDIAQYTWRNNAWAGTSYRRSHVQEFTNPAIAVLHVTVFPNLDDPSPIYGFDVITGKNRPSGCYIDLSPTIEAWEGWSDWGSMDYEFKNKRKIPDWGTCFSSEFVAITMDDEIELERALICGINLLESYLSRLQINQTLNHVWDEEAVYQKQESYCVQQRKNDKTLNVLSRMIGEEQANYYMNHVLFPNPKE